MSHKTTRQKPTRECASLPYLAIMDIEPVAMLKHAAVLEESGGLLVAHSLDEVECRVAILCHGDGESN